MERGDKIRLSDWEAMAFVGILPKEHAAPQRVQFTVTLWLSLEACGSQADLTQSVNYADVLASVNALTDGGHWPLLESLGRAICAMLLLPPLAGGAQVQAVEVSMSKPDILGGRAVPSVTLFREFPMNTPQKSQAWLLHSEPIVSAVVEDVPHDEPSDNDAQTTILGQTHEHVRRLVVRSGPYSL